MTNGPGVPGMPEQRKFAVPASAASALYVQQQMALRHDI